MRNEIINQVRFITQNPTLIFWEEFFKGALPQKSGLQCNDAVFQMLDL